MPKHFLYMNYHIASIKWRSLFCEYKAKWSPKLYYIIDFLRVEFAKELPLRTMELG